MSSYLEAAVTLAFWVSFGLIGFGATLLFRRQPRLNSIIGFIMSAPLAARCLLFEAAGLALMVPWIAIGFAVQAPIAYLDGIYILHLLAGVTLMAWWGRQVLAKGTLGTIRNFRPKLSLVLVSMVVLAGVLAVDYVVASKVGAYIANGNDAYVHMGKIEQLAHGRLTLADPYFAGVVESRYHVNIVHSLYAVGVSLTGITTMNFWEHAAPFFRLLCWLSVFLVAWYFSPIRQKRLFAAFATVIAVPLFSWAFVAADYPNVLVLVWLSIWLVGLSRFIQGKDAWLLLAGALLAAATHPAYAFGAAGFMVITAAYMAVFRWSWLTKTRSIVLAVTILLLVTTTLITLHYPNRLGQATQEFGNIPTLTIGGGAVIKKPVIPDLTSWALLLLPLSIIGYGYIIRTRNDKTERWLLGLLVAYFALLAYNPLLSMVAGHQLPPWLLERFSFVNRLQIVAVCAGLIGVLAWLNRFVHVRGSWQRTGIIALAAIPLLLASITPLRLYTDTRTANAGQIQLMRSLETIEPLIHGQHVYAMPGDSFILPAVTTVHVVSMPETNASPVANMTRRKQCSTVLEQTLSADALHAAGVTRVMIGAWEPELMDLARSKPYLKLIGGNGAYNVFAFNKTKVFNTVKICEIPYGQ